MKTLIPAVVDTIFTAFITVLRFFILFSYFIPRPFAFTFSAIFCCLIALFIFKHLKIKQERAHLSKAERDAGDIMSAQLNLYPQKEQLDFFFGVLKKSGYIVERKNCYLILPDKHAVIYPKFSFDGVTKTDVVKVFNALRRTDNAFILSEKFNSEITEFAARFDNRIQTVSADKIYQFLSEKDCLPKEKFVFKDSQKLSLYAFKIFIHKKKAGYNLLIGLAFLVMSYFVPIKTYYIIVGSIFLILSLFCRLFGIEEKQENA